MQVSLVYIHVKSEYVGQFKEASLENARNSVKEDGIARFDFMQQSDDPTRFVLIEVFRSEGAPAQHRETSHYQKWRSTVEKMMDEPRSHAQYTNLFPEDSDW